MSHLVLIDTSVWVDLLRGTAKPARAEEVRQLLQEARGAWCGMVRLD